MNIDHVSIGVWHNVAIAAGTNPRDAIDSYNARYRDMYEREEPEPDLSNFDRFSLGSIGVFDGVWTDKEQALKVLEEAAEVYASWQAWDSAYQRLHNARDILDTQPMEIREHDARAYLIEECCDTLQAIANLLNGLGVRDLAPYLRAVELKNAERGHIYMEVEQ